MRGDHLFNGSHEIRGGLTGARSWAVTILLVIVFATVITLIADLDRPQEGLLQVSQQPLIDLLNTIGTPAP